MKALLFVTRVITIYVLIIILPFLGVFYNMTSHKKEKKEASNISHVQTSVSTTPQ